MKFAETFSQFTFLKDSTRIVHDLQGGYFCCFSALSFSSFVPKSRIGGCRLQLMSVVVNIRFKVMTKNLCILKADLKIVGCEALMN
jgi:hypothetical protein